MESLAVKYRPATFDDLVGQRAVNVILRAMVEQDKVPTALLFKGCRGTGKTTTARILAAALNCEHAGTGADAGQGPTPCAACVSCKAVAAGTSVDLVEIDAASNGLVEDIRNLRTQVLYGVTGRYRVVVLDEAHSMSQAAFNALLKTLEEPPPGTVFVLCTTEPGRICDTVLSRCMPFTFTRIGTADITARLARLAAAEGVSVEPALLGILAGRADGAMRDAEMALDQLLRVGVTTAAGYAELVGDADDGPALLAALTGGDPAAGYTVAQAALTRGTDPAALTRALADTLRDVLVLANGGQIAHTGDALAARTALAQRLDTPAVFAALAVLWEVATKLRAEDARTGLDLAIAMIAARHVPAAVPGAVPSAAAGSVGSADPARRLSLTEMAALR